MLKHCEYCGKPMETEYPNKRFCSEKCARYARFERDESFYEFPHLPDAEPIFSFQCKNCGKEVKVYSKYDQRISFCCGICAKQYQSTRERRRLAKQRYTSNLGMSGGMSLGSLIKREARSVDKEGVIYINICPVCGKKFETPYSYKKYCSLKCKREHYNGRYKDYNREYYRAHHTPKINVRTCPVCGKTFSAPSGQNRRICCSKHCSRIRKAKWKAEHNGKTRNTP